jgi:hypothetical protein
MITTGVDVRERTTDTHINSFRLSNNINVITGKVVGILMMFMAWLRSKDKGLKLQIHS